MQNRRGLDDEPPLALLLGGRKESRHDIALYISRATTAETKPALWVADLPPPSSYFARTTMPLIIAGLPRFHDHRPLVLSGSAGWFPTPETELSISGVGSSAKKNLVIILLPIGFRHVFHDIAYHLGLQGGVYSAKVVLEPIQLGMSSWAIGNVDNH